MPPPVLLWCAFEGDDRDPYPVEDMVWGANLPVRACDNHVGDASLNNIVVVLTALLIEQRAEYVREHWDSADGSLTLLFCSPDQELSRASRVLEFVRGHTGSQANYETFDQNVKALEELLRRYSANDLDDDRLPW